MTRKLMVQTKLMRRQRPVLAYACARVAAAAAVVAVAALRNQRIKSVDFIAQTWLANRPLLIDFDLQNTQSRKA